MLDVKTKIAKFSDFSVFPDRFFSSHQPCILPLKSGIELKKGEFGGKGVK